MGMKKWQTAELDKALAKELAEECGVDPIVALIASSRGYTDPSDLEEFLSDEPCFSDPFLLADIEKAADILNEAVESGVKIAVFGDYDCDGVSSAAIMYTYLQGRGCNCVCYIPDRMDEGYGMNIPAVEKLAADGVGLIITVDNGIACVKEVERAKELGMAVIVTDHHLPGEVLPAADAVVDPHRADCPSDFKEICGAEVAFKLICVAEGKEPEELIYEYADILSVAVTADVMPLKFENRSIVKLGIEKLKNAPSKGLSAIMSVAGLDRNDMNATRIAYGIAPRINAAGRLGSADIAFRLLTTDSMTEALELANRIDALNAERRGTEKSIFEKAAEIIEREGLSHRRVIVVSGENWHPGVVGIVAARITERYGKPTVVISENGDISTGSARSIEGFSIFEAISYSADLLTKFGGHRQAAGLSLKTENINAFREKINEYAESIDFTAPVLRLDCKLKPSALTLDLSEAIKLLEPFGMGNPMPVFGLFGVTLARITPIGGGKHLRLIFSKSENSFQALLFGVTPERFCFKEGDILDAAVTVETNFYAGEYNLSVQIKALRMSGTDDERLFREMDNLELFLSGKSFDINEVFPTRQETGTVYKAIAADPTSAERIKYLLLSNPGYAKTEVSLTVLTELGLIKKGADGVLRTTGAKGDLHNSPTYKKLLERGAEK